MSARLVKLLSFAYFIALAACSAPETPVQTVDSTPSEDDNVIAQMRGQDSSTVGHPGEALYMQHCAECHNLPVARSPHISFLQLSLSSLDK